MRVSYLNETNNHGVVMSRSIIPITLCLFSALAFSACSIADDHGVDVDPRYQHTSKLDPAESARLVVDWSNGNIEVRADDGETVRLTAVGWRGGEPLEPAVWLDKLTFELREGRICCRYDRELFQTVAVSLRLLVPRGFNAEIDTSNGAVAVNGLDSLSVDTSNGDVLVRDTAGPLTVDTSNGEIDISLLGGSIGDIVADSSNGPIKVIISGDHDGAVELSSSNGGLVLRVDGVQRGDVVLDSSNGSLNISYGGFSGSTSGDTSNGSIDVVLGAVPDGLAVEAETTNGEVVCDLPGAELRSGHAGGSISRSGDGPQLLLDTTNGGLTIRYDEDAAPNKPEAAAGATAAEGGA